MNSNTINSHVGATMNIPNDNTRKTTHFLHISQTFRETDEKNSSKSTIEENHYKFEFFGGNSIYKWWKWNDLCKMWRSEDEEEEKTFKWLDI